MGAEFNLMDEHKEAPGVGGSGGKLVLSRLKPGRTALAAPAPSLKLVLEGEEVYEVDGRSVRVEPGQFLYLDAGRDCVAINRTDAIGLCLTLPREQLAFENEGSPAADPVLGRALLLSTRTSSFGRLLEQTGRRIARNPELGRELADRLVASTAEAITEPLAESRAAIQALQTVRPATRRDIYQRLERARHFLHCNDERNVTLGELAGRCGLSQFHFARYFKLAFGQAPIAYHRGLRLARAADLIAGGGRSLGDIAEAAGYSDAVALSHAFRKQFGHSPHHWQLARGQTARSKS